MESILFIFSLIMIVLVLLLVKSNYSKNWKILSIFSFIYFLLIGVIGVIGVFNNLGFTYVERRNIYLIFCFVYIIIFALLSIILMLIPKKNTAEYDPQAEEKPINSAEFYSDESSMTPFASNEDDSPEAENQKSDLDGNSSKENIQEENEPE